MTTTAEFRQINFVVRFKPSPETLPAVGWRVDRDQINGPVVLYDLERYQADEVFREEIKSMCCRLAHYHQVSASQEAVKEYLDQVAARAPAGQHAVIEYR